MRLTYIAERLVGIMDEVLRRRSKNGSSTGQDEPKPVPSQASTVEPSAPSPPPAFDYGLPPSVNLDPKSPLEEEVLKVLEPLIDPGTGMGLVEMGLITHLHADDKGAVAVTFRPSSNVCPLAFQLGEDIVGAVASVDGVADVEFRVENYVRAKELEEALNGQ